MTKSHPKCWPPLPSPLSRPSPMWVWPVQSLTQSPPLYLQPTPSPSLVGGDNTPHPFTGTYPIIYMCMLLSVSFDSPFCGPSGSVATTPVATDTTGLLRPGSNVLLRAVICQESDGKYNSIACVCVMCNVIPFIVTYHCDMYYCL